MTEAEKYCNKLDEEIGEQWSNDYIDLPKYVQSFADEQVKKVKQDYLLSSKNKATIFWQIDQIERVRSGKVMLYNPKNGRRVKDDEG